MSPSPGLLHSLLTSLPGLTSACLSSTKRSVVLLKPKSRQVLCSQLDCGCLFAQSAFRNRTIPHYLPVTHHHQSSWQGAVGGALMTSEYIIGVSSLGGSGTTAQKALPQTSAQLASSTLSSCLLIQCPITHASPTTLFKMAPMHLLHVLHTNTFYCLFGLPSVSSY